MCTLYLEPIDGILPNLHTLGHGKEVIRCLQPWTHFQGHYIIKTKKKHFVHSTSWINRWNLTKLTQMFRDGWFRQSSHVSYVIGAPNWYWLTVGQGLLSLLQVMVERECSNFFCFVAFFPFPLSPIPVFHLLYYLFYLFSPFLWGDDTKWPTRVDVSLNRNTIKNTDISLGWGKEVLRFWWPWPHF